MATTSIKGAVDDTRRTTLSPRLKGRENAKDILCRNVTIYGKCRYEDKGCAFNHDPHKLNAPQAMDSTNNLKKGFNVDSPSFTPSLLSANGAAAGKKTAAISPKAANAAPFLPKSVTPRANAATPPVRQDNTTPEWAVAEVQDFVPQVYDTAQLNQGNGLLPSSNTYDVFAASSTSLATPGTAGAHTQVNPYQDGGSIGGAAYYQGQNSYQQPVQYHLYAPIGPHKADILPYQRNVHDLFISNDLREELQKKAAASLQTFPNSQLPPQIEEYQSLVPLDTSLRKNAAVFGYPSWVYKAQSSTDGSFYVLRRLEGFRLNSDKAVRSVQVQAWKSINCASTVTVHKIFTTRNFHDQSLIFVTDYHPLSKTLAEHHSAAANRYQNRQAGNTVTEPVMWSYVTQIASALKLIHSNKLAARVIDASKILVTGKNRIRLNACAIMDVVQHETQIGVPELQRQDLLKFGILLYSLGTNIQDVSQNSAKAMELFSRYYSRDLNNAVLWLCQAGQMEAPRTVDQFLTLISSQITAAFDATLQLDDQLNIELNRELENARLVRLMTKLNFVNERPEFDHDRQWSENGERYFLKLFRDYVFHQVDAQSHPVVDLGHVLTCLNKLDAGIDERITLVSRDEQTCFVVSYKELKKAIESAFQDLLKPGRRLH